MGQSPQRFSGRAGSRLPGRVRRALDAQIDTERRLDGTLKVDKNGRMGTNISRKGGLLETPQGLAVDPAQVGEMNRAAMKHIIDIDTSSGTLLADTATKMNELLAELRRTGRVKGGF